MDINFLVGFQIVTDVMICLGILFVLIRFHQLFKPGLMEVSGKTILEFSQLLEESRNAAGKFLEELEQEKNALKDLAQSIDEKERRLKDLLEKAKLPMDLLSAHNAQKTDSIEEEPFGKILSLAQQGLNEEQISRQSGLPEGEIDLILNLSRTKSK